MFFSPFLLMDMAVKWLLLAFCPQPLLFRVSFSPYHLFKWHYATNLPDTTARWQLCQQTVFPLATESSVPGHSISWGKLSHLHWFYWDQQSCNSLLQLDKRTAQFPKDTQRPRLIFFFFFHNFNISSKNIRSSSIFSSPPIRNFPQGFLHTDCRLAPAKITLFFPAYWTKGI